MTVIWNREAEDEFVDAADYYVEDEQIHIASIMHTSRHPDYWKSRLRNG